MATPAAVLLCVLLTCPVLAAGGRRLQTDVSNGEREEDVSNGEWGDVSAAGEREEDVSNGEREDESWPETRRIPGTCWVCKWALNKVKKVVGANATAESLKARLLTVCNEIGLLKSSCRRFVKTHLWELIQELSTTDGVRTICVHTGACKPKEEQDREVSQAPTQYFIK